MFRKSDIKNVLRLILRPPYYFIKDISFFSKRLMSKNLTLKNRYEGERGFLLLSGESLNCIDISKLKGEYTGGCGLLFLNKDVRDLPLSFYLQVEAGPIMDKSNRPGWANWPEESIPSKGSSRAYIFLEKIKEHFIDKGTITFLDANKIAYYRRIRLFNFSEPNVFYIKLNPYFFTAKNPNMDLTKRFTGGEGSVFNIILIMIYMGFKEIYLVGAGYTYEPIYQDHFYDNLVFPKSMGKQVVEIEAMKAIEARNKRLGITLEYYGLFEKDDFYRSICVRRKEHDIHKDRHRILNNYAKSQDVKIYNIVPDGFESPIYEKISWQDVESKILSDNLKNSVKK